jgi:endo-1,4-beta-xylanase
LMAIASLIIANSNPAPGKLQFFGAAVPGNINNNFGNVLPLESYFNAVQGDGVWWWSTMEPSQGTFILPTDQYAWCKAHNVKFRIFLGGGTSPGWVAGLDVNSAEQAWETFLQQLAAACPNIDIINLGNEPITTHEWSFFTANKLGGYGSTGWAWCINAYRIVKSYFPHTLCGWNQWGCDVPGQIAFSQYLSLNKAAAAAHAIDYIGLEFYCGNWWGSTFWTAAQIQSGLQAYHAACPGVPIIITEFSPVTWDANEQLQMTQTAMRVFLSDPLVIGIMLWDPDSAYAVPEGIGMGFFSDSGVSTPAFNWLINNIP